MKTDKQLMTILEEFIMKQPKARQKCAAKKLGVSASYLSELRNGIKPITDTLAFKLGYQRRWIRK